MIELRTFSWLSGALVACGACANNAETGPTPDSGGPLHVNTGGSASDTTGGGSGHSAAATGGTPNDDSSAGGGAGAANGGSSGLPAGGAGGGAGTPNGGSSGAPGGAGGTQGVPDSGSSGASAADSGGSASPGNGWTRVWEDEFEGSSIDSSKWEHEVDCWGGGNGEEQCYVSAAKNSYVEAGVLHIVALKDQPSGRVSATDPTVVTKPYSSARLRTRGRGDWKYGRIEVRAKLPFGQGIWPAIWMLPTEAAYGGWAASGEIDIMEAVNLRPGANEIHGTLHYGGSWPANVHSGTHYRPPNNVWEQFHLYAVEWQEGEVRWFVDETHYATQTEWRSSNGAYPAPFDQEFHLLLNVAVGGQWPGPPNDTTTFPQEMVVDYVRVYACSSDRTTGRGCGTSDPAVRPL